jgi:hypothetical protein
MDAVSNPLRGKSWCQLKTRLPQAATRSNGAFLRHGVAGAVGPSYLLMGIGRGRGWKREDTER